MKLFTNYVGRFTRWLPSLLLAGQPLLSQAQIILNASGNYAQNFDNITSSGLPAGVTVWNTPTATSFGAASNLVAAGAAANNTSAGFKNVVSATGYTTSAAYAPFGNTATTTGAGYTNRALGVRQTAANDLGVGFVFQLANTIGFTDVQLSFKLQSLDPASPRITTWRVDYAVGASPTSFSLPASTSGTLTTGGTGTFTNNTVTANFGSALDNKAGPIYLRIVSIQPTSGSGNRVTSALDDFALSATPNAPGAAYISSLAPTTVAAGGSAFTLTVNGANFTAGSAVNFNGTALVTTFVSATQLTTTVPAAAIATPNNNPVTVTTGAAMSTAVLFPVSGSFYSLIGDLSDPVSYGTNPDGSGAKPASLALPFVTYFIGGTGRTFSAPATLDPTSALTVLSGTDLAISTVSNLTGLVNLQANATLVQQNAAPAITLGTVDVASTVNFAQTSTFTVPNASYGNLTLSGGTKLFSGAGGPGVTTVRGNLTADGVTDLNGSAPAFATVYLNGDFTLLNNTNFSTNTGSRFTLVLQSNGTQTLSGNGSDFNLFRVTTLGTTNGVLSTAGGSSNLVLGNPSGGGLSLANGTSLTLNGNNLTLIGNSLFIATGATLLGGAGSAVTINHTGTAILGTLPLNAGQTLGSLTLNATSTSSAANTLTLPGGALSFGGLTLTAGVLVLGGGSLTLSGPVGAGTGTLTGSAGSSLASTSPTAGAALTFTPGGQTLKDLTVNGTGGLTINNPLTVGGAFTLSSGVLDLSGNALTLNGTLGAASGGFLKGSVTTNLSVNTSGGGTLAFAPGFQTLNNLTVNAAGGFTLGSPLTVTGTLALTNGLVTAPTTNPLTLLSPNLTGGSAASYVSGPLGRLTAPGAATTVFPIGRGGNYRPLTLTTTTQNNPTVYRAEQTEANAGQSFATPDPNGAQLLRVSAFRYFTLMPYDPTGMTLTPPSGYAGTVTLSFGDNDGVNVPNDPDLKVAKRDAAGPYAGLWVNQGNTASTGGPGNGPGGNAVGISGSITSASFTGFSDFALGATNLNALPATQINPLPVQLTAFTAARVGIGAVQLRWTTASELNSARFEVERGVDGRSFAKIGEQAAQGTRMTRTDYALTDASAPATMLYYRLRQVDQDGTARYSATVAVAVTGDALVGNFSLSPNPTRHTISFHAPPATAYVVRSVLGQTLRAGTSRPDGAPTTLDVADLPAGVYLVEWQMSAGRVVRRFVKE